MYIYLYICIYTEKVLHIVARKILEGKDTTDVSVHATGFDE